MARSILHMLTPLKHMSPFDVNMAVDAGFEVVSTYTGVELAEVVPLVQDSIFSRAPQDGTRTAIFIGGKNAEAALDMVDAATGAFVPPFANHVFADPAGSFT
ncbi:methylenetetrahydromethanopterin dehydrogenase, partial [Methylobacterium frigidaeris]